MPDGLNNAFLSREVLESLGFKKLGDNVLIHSTVVIVDCKGISIGSRVRIDPFVVISNRGGLEIGNNVHIGGHSVLAGQAAIKLEDFVNISHYVGIYTSCDDSSGRTLINPTISEEFSAPRTASISFGRHSGVGSACTILPGAKFAEGSILGAMSRIGRPTKPWTTYAGIPARRMSERRRDVIEEEHAYLASLKKIR